MIRSCVLILGVLALPLAGKAENAGVKTYLAGSTVRSMPPKTTAHLDLTTADALLLFARKAELRIPYGKVNSLEYGQNVSRRFAAALLISPVLLLSKTRRHYVTLGYVDDAGSQQAVVFRVDKNDIRVLLAALEARTGRRVEYQDSEARRSPR